jgi:hypothetical protein
MSRWSHASEKDIYRALVVDEFGPASWREYVRIQSRADPAEGGE